MERQPWPRGQDSVSRAATGPSRRAAGRGGAGAAGPRAGGSRRAAGQEEPGQPRRGTGGDGARRGATVTVDARVQKSQGGHSQLPWEPPGRTWPLRGTCPLLCSWRARRGCDRTPLARARRCHQQWQLHVAPGSLKKGRERNLTRVTGTKKGRHVTARTTAAAESERARSPSLNELYSNQRVRGYQRHPRSPRKPTRTTAGCSGRPGMLRARTAGLGGHRPPRPGPTRRPQTRAAAGANDRVNERAKYPGEFL